MSGYLCNLQIVYLCSVNTSFSVYMLTERDTLLLLGPIPIILDNYKEIPIIMTCSIMYHTFICVINITHVIFMIDQILRKPPPLPRPRESALTMVQTSTVSI